MGRWWPSGSRPQWLGWVSIEEEEEEKKQPLAIVNRCACSLARQHSALAKKRKGERMTINVWRRRTAVAEFLLFAHDAHSRGQTATNLGRIADVRHGGGRLRALQMRDYPAQIIDAFARSRARAGLAWQSRAGRPVDARLGARGGACLWEGLNSADERVLRECLIGGRAMMSVVRARREEEPAWAGPNTHISLSPPFP